MNKELFEKFAQGIKENKGNFIFEIKEDGYIKPKIYIVITTEVYGAKYVYYDYSYDKDDAINMLIEGKIDKMQFAMLVKDNNFIVSKWVFSTRPDNGESLPSNVKTWEEIIKEYKNIYDTEMKKLYDSITVTNNFSEEIINLKEKARKYQIYNLNVFDSLKEYVTMNEIEYNDIKKCVIGYTSKEDTIKNIVNSNREKLALLKSKVAYVENLIVNNEVVKPWELDIVKPLNEIKDIAKTVNVTFELNEITGTEKVEITRLIDYIFYKSTFSDYSFCNGAKGKELLHKLNAGGRYNTDTNKYEKIPLTVENIIKITYGKKVLFER
jgi:hypothetical protein